MISNKLSSLKNKEGSIISKECISQSLNLLNGANGYWCLTVSYVGTIADSTTLKLRLKNGGATQVDFAKITMTVIEI